MELRAGLSACLSLCLLVIGCGGSQERGPFSPPDQAGPNRAGFVTGTAPGPEDLQLPVYAWYPVTEGLEQDLDYDGIGLTHGRAVPGGSGACPTARPVVVFSHGYGGIGYQTYSLSEHLARHGYVVAACDHVHNTIFEQDDTLWAALVMRRPLDVAATFDWLVAQAADPDSPLSGCVDPAAGYAVVGHSFGGFSSLATAGASLDMAYLEAGCEQVRAWRAAHPGQDSLDDSDPRVWAALPLAPAWYEVFGDGLAGIAVPTLVIGGEIDDTTPWAAEVEPAYRGLTALPRYLGQLEGAGHLSFTDFCPVVGSGENGCGPDARPVEQVLADLRATVLAFLEVVRGDERARDWLPPETGYSLWEAVEQ